MRSEKSVNLQEAAIVSPLSVLIYLPLFGMHGNRKSKPTKENTQAANVKVILFDGIWFLLAFDDSKSADLYGDYVIFSSGGKLGLCEQRVNYWTIND